MKTLNPEIFFIRLDAQSVIVTSNLEFGGGTKEADIDEAGVGERDSYHVVGPRDYDLW